MSNVTPIIAGRTSRSEDVTWSARALANEALETVAGLMRGDIKASATVRLKACQEILDRAYGRAPITVDVTQQLTSEEIREAAVQILTAEPNLLPPPTCGENTPGGVPDPTRPPVPTRLGKEKDHHGRPPK